ncbi:hypothetical protein IMG5_194610 [Ichthyophthirius multifiliis]|uniref:LITAF domain-containing protein n=1 Tax=Ichthyophthirius multifiliis TaxID=5932 RepID=G0R4S4_ICHMU|nr:hypothetical protein IMG5_194610 [Ichthyophthirius multifiliis]EGR27512.1 hypothetical protein IMG5_194610 [Ichthyophthirius multifiliis]|eukprot:XP_004024933.1 hypothetical protein IMG5_194610 [Ichthyophthirius multifiliis]
MNSAPSEQTGLQNGQNQNKYQAILINYECKYCHTSGQPIRYHQAGTGTYLCCLIWCFIAVIPGLIPFCCNRCKDQVLKCASCSNIIEKEYYEPCDCTRK